MPLAFALRHASAPIHYRIDASDVRAHLYRVTLTIAHASAHQVLALPVWIPGSYMVREFSKHVQKLRAYSSPSANISDGAEAQPIALQQLDKCTWQANCKAGSRLVLEYEVYAFDNSVRTAWLDAARGFFNASSLCLRVAGRQCSSGGPQAHGGVIEFHGLPSELEVAMVGPQGHGGYSSAAL